MCQRIWQSFALLILTGFATTTLQARPYTYNYRAFIGGDVQHLILETTNYNPVYLSTTIGAVPVQLGTITINKGQLKNNDDAFSFYAGYNLYNVGIQFGYMRLNEITYPYYSAATVGGTNFYAKQKGNNVFLDFSYNCQISCRNAVQMFLGVGALKTYIDFYFISTTAPSVGYFYDFQVKNTRIAPRFGVAWQYSINNCWAASVSYKFQTGNALYKYMQSFALGLNYYFL